MLELVYTNQFKRDYKRIRKRRKDIEKQLGRVVQKLLRRKILEPKYRDHKLFGHLSDCRECHIGPDWLLIYRIDRSNLVLERMGSHADLFE